MARRYHVSPLPTPGTHTLPPEVAHHVAHVMRTRPGAPLVLFDGAGRECRGEIVSIRKVHQEAVVEARLGEPVTSQREPDVLVEAAFAMPKGHRADWLFEHGTEVGIRRFRPVLCSRGNPEPDAAARADRRHQRWQRICQAAAGQCDRAFVPDIAAVVPLQDLFGEPSSQVEALPQERYLAHDDGPPLAAATGNHVLLLVGPAGGFTADEVDAAIAAGCEPRSLGPLTLRTETAVLAGAVRLMGNG
ncbi:MAG: RsmE family RNA methyltransferase [Planctomycetota bacterium]